MVQKPIMGKSVRARFELVKESDVRAICTIDAPLLSSHKVSDFVESNLLNYYTLANCWLAIIEQYSPNGWAYVRQFMLDQGMVSLIREFDTSAKDLINGSPLSSRLASTLYSDVKRSLPLSGIQTDVTKQFHDNPKAAMLQILRFGKRFSPIKADLLQKASIDAFIDTQIRLKQLQHQEPSRYILSKCRDEARRLCRWSRIVRDLGRMKPWDLSFTPGVTFETDSSLLEKLRFVADHEPWRIRQPFGVPLFALNCEDKRESYGPDGAFDVRSVRVIAVPKNYKSSRIIAPENVIRQARAKWAFDILDGYSPVGIDLHDQEKNATLACEGSIDGSLATIDLHAASDSITWPLLSSILPCEFCDAILPMLPTHYFVGDRRSMLQTATPMGNSLTFWIESVVFLAICRAAVRCYNTFTGEHDMTISVYGDDIIVPSHAAPTVIEFLEALGFIVNEDKTFFQEDVLYRESCGHEYLEGIELTSFYFPRFPLVGKIGGDLSRRHRFDAYNRTIITSMTALLDLQHKMFYLCDRASHLVRSLILEADSKMTESSPDAELQDILSYDARDVERLPLHSLGKGVPQDTIEKWREWGVLRHMHSTPVLSVSTKGRKPLREEDVLLIKTYQYNEFLRNGPRYDDDLSRTLGISEPPLSPEEAAGYTDVVWALTEP